MTTLKQIAARFTRLRVDANRDDADRLLDLGVHFLQHGFEMKADRDRLFDIAAFLRDIISNLEGEMKRELDDVELVDEYRPLDTSQLDEMLAKEAKRP